MLQGIAALMISRKTGFIAPTIFGSPNTNQSTTTTSVTTLSGLPAACLLVLTCASADDSSAFPNGSVVSSPVLTWTKQVQSKAANSGDTEIWTATFSAGGSITVTWTGSVGATALSSVLYCIQNGFVGNSNSAVSQTNASVAVTTSSASSLLFCVTSDWNATNPAGHAYRDSATEVLLDNQPGIYVGYHYRKTATTATSYTEGLTAPTSGTNIGTSVLEIKGG